MMSSTASLRDAANTFDCFQFGLHHMQVGYVALGAAAAMEQAGKSTPVSAMGDDGNDTACVLPVIRRADFDFYLEVCVLPAKIADADARMRISGVLPRVSV